MLLSLLILLFITPSIHLLAQECSLQIVIQNKVCNDNGTTADESDDTYTFDLIVISDTNEGQWDGSGSLLGGGIFQFGPTNYGETISLGPFAAGDFTPTNITPPTLVMGGMSVDINVNDLADPTCRVSMEVNSPGICSVAPTAECVVSLSVTDILCNNEGTPRDPSDDTYTFSVEVFRTGGTMGDGYLLEVNNGNLGIFLQEGTYGQVHLLGPFPTGFDMTLIATTNGTPSCTDNTVVPSPVACSNEMVECAIGADVTNITCDDNNTPSDNTDDTFTFDLTAFRTGGTVGDEWTANLDNANLGAFIQTGTYATPVPLGPFPIGNDININVTHNGTTSCSANTIAISPAACSAALVECAIGIDVSETVCDDNGTPFNPSDDTFTFSYTVFRTGGTISDGWEGSWSTGDTAIPLTGNYNERVELGPFSLLAQSQLDIFTQFRRSVFISVDALGNNDCRDTAEVLAPESCSTTTPCSVAGTFNVADGCLTEEFIIFVDANDAYNPPNNPRYIYDYDFGGDLTLLGASTVDPRSLNVTYRLPGTKSVTATLTDRNDPTCVQIFAATFVVTDCEVEAPEVAGSEGCGVVIDIANNSCTQEGLFSFDLTVLRTGGTIGDTWEGTLRTGDIGRGITGTYNQTQSFEFAALQQVPLPNNPLNLVRRSVSIQLNAVSDIDCKDEKEVFAPVDCSTAPVECAIGIDVSETVCNDNDTPDNPNDDTFTFSYMVVRTGGTISDGWEGSWSTGDTAIPLTGNYNERIELGPFSLIAQSQLDALTLFRRTVFISVDAMGNTDCNDSVEVTSPESCSNSYVDGGVVVDGTDGEGGGTVNGDIEVTDYCADVSITGGVAQISISGVTAPWRRVLFRLNGGYSELCNDDCSNPAIFTGLEAGVYTIRVEQSNGGSDGYCLIEVPVTVSSPAPPTTIDYCANVFVTGGAGQITIGGLTAPYKRLLYRLNGGYTELCSADCNNPSVYTGLEAGVYTIRVEQSNGGTNGYCFIEIPVTVTTFSASNTNGYCANTSAIGGPGQILIKGVDAPWHRIQYRFINSSIYSDICNDNCHAPQLIYGLPANSYVVKIQQSDHSGGAYCEQEFTVGVSQYLKGAESRRASYMNFNVFKQDREVQLEWLTNTTYKSDYYIIERSLDGTSFEELSMVLNKPVGLETGYFKSADMQPVLGDNFYRLKQVFQDGSHEYSSIRRIQFGVDLGAIGLFPNPAQQELYINLKEYAGKSATIFIIDQYGLVKEQYQIEDLTEELIRIDLAAYTNGLYYIRTKIDRTKFIAQKFIVSKMY